MADKKISLITVLPLEGVGLMLEGGRKREELVNGYVLVQSEMLPELEKFDDDYMATLLSKSEWSRVRHANLYLWVTAENPSGASIDEVRTKGCADCGEKIDRILLAFNINEKLWSFRPDVRLSWFDKDCPLSSQNIIVKHHSPISTFEGGLTVRDFRDAAQLTTKIDNVYSAIDDGAEGYPAIRTAFDAIRLGAYAFNTSMRFLQEAITLESLCSTDTSEVAHKVAVACALCLESKMEERKELYRQAKSLYAIRSRVIHGSGRRVKKEELMQIEKLSRRLLRYVLNDDVLPKFRTRDFQREFLLDLALRES
jgi:hypothetical protein